MSLVHGQDKDEISHPIMVNTVGMIIPDSSNLQIPAGNIPGFSSVNKFGRSTNVDSGVATDIWDRANTTNDQDIWVAPTQARIHSIVSASDEDSDVGGVVAQGSGARTIKVYGLTSWDTKEVSEDIIMDGTTAVNTVNSYVIIHRIKVLTKGGNAAGPNVGLITATAATDGTVTAQINAAEGQTQMAIYGIPSIQTAYMSTMFCSINRASVGATAAAIDGRILFNSEPNNELTNFLTKFTFGLLNTGGSPYNNPFNPYDKYSGPGIFKMQATGGTNNLDVSGRFGLYLVDN